MNWENILKDKQSYNEMLILIEKVENMLEKLYEDIEESAIKMNKETGYPLESARKLITNIHEDTRREIEKTLKEYRDALPQHIKR